jgi:hypothetical protein
MGRQEEAQNRVLQQWRKECLDAVRRPFSIRRLLISLNMAKQIALEAHQATLR